MAAVTTAVIGVAASGYQIYNAQEQKKEAKKALNEHKPQDLANNHEKIRLSTSGTDLMREESGRVAASAVEASRGGGIRGVMSSIPKIQEYANKTNREIQVDLDDQIIKRDYAIAEESERIRTVQEKRDEDKLAGLGTSLNVANQDTFSGIRGGINAIAYGLNAIEGDSTEEEKAAKKQARQDKRAARKQARQDRRSADIGGDYMEMDPYDEYLKRKQEAAYRSEFTPTYGLG